MVGSECEDKATAPEDRAVVNSAATRSMHLAVLAGFLLLLGAYLRLKNFGYPESFQFDEHHFVENARNYLSHRPDWNDHPPLGKLVITASIAAFGDNPVSWRLPSLVFGIATVVLSGSVARRLFHSQWALLFASAFASVDGFLIAYSRAALLDGLFCTMSLLSLLAATLERRRRVHRVLDAGRAGRRRHRDVREILGSGCAGCTRLGVALLKRQARRENSSGIRIGSGRAGNVRRLLLAGFQSTGHAARSATSHL